MSQVTIYTKASCIYCDRAKQLLNHKKIHFREIHVDQNPEFLEEMIQRSGGRRTVPQIFINGQSIGGFDDLYALDKGEKLNSLIHESAS